MFHYTPTADSAIELTETSRFPLAEQFHQIDLKNFLFHLRTQKRFILGVTLLFVAAAILFLLLSTPQYAARTQILIDPSDLHVVERGLTSNSQVSEAIVIQVESQVRVLTSDNVLRRVVAREGLDADREFGGSQASLSRAIANAILTPLGMSHLVGRVDPTLAALYELQRRTSAKRAERTYVVDVGVTTEDPIKSTRLTNAIAQAYLDEQTTARSDTARQASETLAARLSELKDRVRQAEQRVEEFKARNNILGASGQLVNEQQLSELNNQLSLARARTAEARARFDQVKALQRSGADLGAFTESVQSATIMTLRSQYAEINRRQAEQMAALGPRHPAVIEIRAQSQRLRGLIEEEINRIAAAAATDYGRAQASEDSLTRSLEELKRNAVLTNGARVGLRELEREVQASRAVYEAFLVRARETGEQERLDTKNVRIISKADVPLRRSWPPSPLPVVFGAILLGIFTGTGLTLLRPRNQGAHQKPLLDESALSLPVMAQLPAIRTEDPLALFQNPNGSAAMELRRLQNAIRGPRPKWTGQKVLLLAQHDYASSAAVAINLAVLAAANNSVLLIDTDIRRRMISMLVSNVGEACLMDVLTGRKLLSESVIHDKRTNLNFLPLLANTNVSYGNIEDKEITSAFDQMKRYDLVVVVATNEDDDQLGPSLANLIQDIVLVARSGTDPRWFDTMISSFGENAHKIRGIVMTHTGGPKLQ